MNLLTVNVLAACGGINDAFDYGDGTCLLILNASATETLNFDGNVGCSSCETCYVGENLNTFTYSNGGNVRNNACWQTNYTYSGVNINWVNVTNTIGGNSDASGSNWTHRLVIQGTTYDNKTET